MQGGPATLPKLPRPMAKPKCSERLGSLKNSMIRAMAELKIT